MAALDTPFKHVPNVLDRIHVRTLRRPWHCLNVVISKHICGCSSVVACSVILDNGHTLICTHVWDEYWLDDVILESSCVRVFLDKDKLCLGIQ